MFRIGDFSRIARVSARLLRFYDEIGLFAPAHTDAQTGYRYYTVAQLGELNRITVLKELGFSLEQARDMLQSPPGATALRSMLLLRRLDAERTLAAEAQRLRQIETRIVQIETDQGLANVDAIAAVPGVDVLWVGQFDLTNFLGIPGDFAHPRFGAALDRILGACASRGVTPAILAMDDASASDFARRGFRMMAYGVDHLLLQEAMRQGIERLRAAAPRKDGR